MTEGSIDEFEGLIERALEYGNGTHRFADIRRMVSSGEVHFWPGVRSCIVTELVNSPGKRFLNFFLAAGNLRELAAMTPLILEWGKSQGCTHAILTGRKGWSSDRLFLHRTGWKQQHYVIMEKEIL